MIRSLLLSRTTNITSVRTHRVILSARTPGKAPLSASVAPSSASSSRMLAVLVSSTNDGSSQRNTIPAILAGSISRSSSSNAHEHARQHAPSWWAWLAIGMGGSTLCVAQCEEVQQQQDDDDDDDDFVEEDPYDNLPPEDEPTHCSICLTYRQGPCRPYWRKVERCTKDHEFKKEEQEVEDAKQGVVNAGNKENAKGKQDDEEEEEEDQQEPPCLKYMLPWIDCASSYRNLYSLIELDTNYTAGILDLEKEAAVDLCWAPSAEPAIDWTPWQAYVAENPSWKLPKRAATKKKHDKESTTISLWKTLDANTDPELVDVLAMVPTKQGEGIIECAYALDQEGNVLGFSYGTKPSEAAKQAEEDASVTEDGQEEPADLIELKIRLLPLRTRHIIIAAAYTQPLPKKDSTSTTTTEPESHIFKSRPFSLKKMSKAK